MSEQMVWAVAMICGTVIVCAMLIACVLVAQRDQQNNEYECECEKGSKTE